MTDQFRYRRLAEVSGASCKSCFYFCDETQNCQRYPPTTIPQVTEMWSKAKDKYVPMTTLVYASPCVDLEKGWCGEYSQAPTVGVKGDTQP